MGKGKFRPNFQISFSTILRNKIMWKYKSFHLNGHIVGFRPQTQKLESPYKTLSNTLTLKGLRCIKAMLHSINHEFLSGNSLRNLKWASSNRHPMLNDCMGLKLWPVCTDVAQYTTVTWILFFMHLLFKATFKHSSSFFEFLHFLSIRSCDFFVSLHVPRTKI